MIPEQQIGTLSGTTVVGSDGELGTVTDVYLDYTTGRPEWAVVRTGPDDDGRAFLPLAEATLSGDRLEVPYDVSTVQDSPHRDLAVEGHLSAHEEAALYRHYGIGAGRSVADAVGTVRGPEPADRPGTRLRRFTG
ncbi:PRC-barrel domain-containing protein [Trujillonella humicola]|uniref:PRC-barrel domain-containing protein n=1 Tax=Trujillonella humicola TaxID=3383699 RepID=UPI003906360E